MSATSGDIVAAVLGEPTGRPQTPAPPPTRTHAPPRGWMRAQAVYRRSRPGTRAHTRARATMRYWEARWLGAPRTP